MWVALPVVWALLAMLARRRWARVALRVPSLAAPAAQRGPQAAEVWQAQAAAQAGRRGVLPAQQGLLEPRAVAREVWRAVVVPG